MPALQKKENNIIKLNVWELISETNRYIIENPQFSLCIGVVNMVFMLFFKSLNGGIANPLSFVWMIAYYIFWCAFYRYYYHLRPYLFSKTIFGSLTPSTKALLLMFIVTLIILFAPMFPLILGFDDVYLSYYERYISAVESFSSSSDIGASFMDVFVVYGIMALLSPVLICKPYMAWISSLRGHNSSFRKAGDKTKGNYWAFVAISAMLLYPEAISDQIDKIYGLQKWFSYSCSTIIFVYTNIIFAKMYDIFYLRH